MHWAQAAGPNTTAFELAGAGEAETFRFLDSIRLIKLAVSLGATESLIEHPATMTHGDVPPQAQAAIGITPAMIRLSVGIEHPDDLIKVLAEGPGRGAGARGDGAHGPVGNTRPAAGPLQP